MNFGPRLAGFELKNMAQNAKIQQAYRCLSQKQTRQSWDATKKIRAFHQQNSLKKAPRKARCRSKIPPVHRADVQVILGNLFSFDASSEIFTSRVLGEIKLATRHDGHRMEGFVALV